MTRRRDPHAATKAVGDVTPTHATRRSGLRPRRLLIFANPIHAATKAAGDVPPTSAIPWARCLSPRKPPPPWGVPTRCHPPPNHPPTTKPPATPRRFLLPPTPTPTPRRSGLPPRRPLIFPNPLHAATKAVGDVAPTYAIPWARWLSPRKQSRPWGAPTRCTPRINAPPTKKPPGITGRFVTALTPVLSPRRHRHPALPPAGRHLPPPHQGHH